MADQSINFNINPDTTPILAVDGYLITSNEHLLTLGFAQALPGDGKQQQIVSRVAMNPKQAKEFLEKLSDHIQKFEV
jgi:hypothetical protein